MQKITGLLLFSAGPLFVSGMDALAQSSLGIGAGEPVVNPSGPFASMLLWLQFWQRTFEQLLSGWLVDFRQNSENAFWLVLVSFAYGVLHAAGPGHGKAVVSSYLVANNETLRRGIFLSFLSSVLQALTAIVLVFSVFFLLPARLTQTTGWLTNASYALVMLLGLWLLIRKTPALIAGKKADTAASALFSENQQQTDIRPDSDNCTDQSGPSRYGLKWRKNNIPRGLFHNGEICTVCGDSHILPAALISDNAGWKNTGWKPALPVILSVGLRPCTGAIFIMSFAVLNGLSVIGSLSVLAMAFGTFVTVSILAALAVNARNLVMNLTGKTANRFRMQILMEWGAALFIFMTGLLLFASAIY